MVYGLELFRSVRVWVEGCLALWGFRVWGCLGFWDFGVLCVCLTWIQSRAFRRHLEQSLPLRERARHFRYNRYIRTQQLEKRVEATR